MFLNIKNIILLTTNTFLIEVGCIFYSVHWSEGILGVNNSFEQVKAIWELPVQWTWQKQAFVVQDSEILAVKAALAWSTVLSHYEAQSAYRKSSWQRWDGRSIWSSQQDRLINLTPLQNLRTRPKPKLSKHCWKTYCAWVKLEP